MTVRLLLCVLSIRDKQLLTKFVHGIHDDIFLVLAQRRSPFAAPTMT